MLVRRVAQVKDDLAKCPMLGAVGPHGCKHLMYCFWCLSGKGTMRGAVCCLSAAETRAYISN